MFQVGDIVECVANSNVERYLTKGERYQVAELLCNEFFNDMIRVKDVHGGWGSDRFVKVVQPALPPAPVYNTQAEECHALLCYHLHRIEKAYPEAKQSVRRAAYYAKRLLENKP